MRRALFRCGLGGAVLSLVLSWPVGAQQANETTQQAVRLIHAQRGVRLQALEQLRLRGKVDAVPAIIKVLRLMGPDRPQFAGVLRELTGADVGDDWFDWMVWQEAHPEITPFAGFDTFSSLFFATIDPAFRRFVRPGMQHDIRLEEIVWGGVKVDAIPALTNPTLIPAADAAYLRDEDAVFGIEINGDVRAYPFRIMNWHEMFNDVIGGVPVSLAYCTLCGSGILFNTAVPDREEPFTFGSSGLLYRSNKLMYDRQTDSLWNQFTGRPVAGPLTGSGIELDLLPVTITQWGKWRARHPETRVLSRETGYDRGGYQPGGAYANYFAHPDIVFPTRTDDARLAPKDLVFGMRLPGGVKAWAISAFADTPVINDRVGRTAVVLIGNATDRTVRAYEAGEREFAAGIAADEVVADGQTWRVTEDALVGPDGDTLPRLPGHMAYWFAWSAFLRESELYLGRPATSATAGGVTP